MATQEMIYQTRTILHNLIMDKWLAEDLFSLRWWAMIGLIVFSYSLCFSLFDKRRLSRLFLFGSLVTVGAVVYETIGVNFVLWVCTTPVFPIIPCLLVPYLTILPIYYMLIFQYTSTWRQFSLWNLVAVSIYSFILLPVLIHFKIVRLDNWEPFYHIPLIFFIATLARAVTLLLEKVEQGQEGRARAAWPAALAEPAGKPADPETDRNKKR